MKHKHNFQFVEKIDRHPVYKIKEMNDSIPDLIPSMEIIDWSKDQYEFICECGKVKLVSPK